MDPFPSARHRQVGLLVGFAQQMAERLGAEISVWALGWPREEAVARLACLEVKQVIVGESDGALSFQMEAHERVLRGAMEKERPLAVIAGPFPWGRELSARVGVRERCWLVPRCTGVLPIDPGWIQVSRQVYGGQFERLAELPLDRPLVASMELNLGSGPGRAGAIPAPVISVEVPSAPGGTISNEIFPVGESQFSLEEAEIVVAAGGGVGDREGFHLVAGLAKALGAILAGSQVVVERGWLPRSLQIGRSGRTVRPGLFLACGVSGSPHFTSGMERSGTIVAINQDPEAPIFGMADVGIVGDLRQVIPAILNEIRTGRPLSDIP